MVQRILVPLDGTRSSASVVPYAAEMASRMPFKVNLLLVQPERGARLPHPEHHQQDSRDRASGKTLQRSSSDHDLTRANERYLARHAQEFHQLGVETEEHLRRGGSSGRDPQRRPRPPLRFHCDGHQVSRAARAIRQAQCG